MDDPVKSARPNECRIQDICSIGGAHDNDPLCCVEAIHLRQQLIQCLVTLIIALCPTPDPAYCIQLVYEDDCGGSSSRLQSYVKHGCVVFLCVGTI